MEERIICGIYKITSPSGRVYVGQSKDIENRWASYRKANCKQQRVLFNSLLKYGWINHIFEIIEECDADNLNCQERFWQDFYQVGERGKGLNCILTGCGELKEKKILAYRNTTVKNKSTGKGILKGEAHPNWGRKYSEFECFKLFVSKSKLSKECRQKLLENFVEGDLEKRYEEIRSKKVMGFGRGKPILDTQTGVFYTSLVELCDLYGFNYDVYKSNLNGKCKNRTSFIYA
jgi:group I intron endonuclease